MKVMNASEGDECEEIYEYELTSTKISLIEI